MVDNEHEEHKRKQERDAEEVREVLTAVSETLPNLIRSLFDSIFSEEAASKLAISIGTLYSKLKEQGLPEDMIREIVDRYISLIPNDLGDILNSKRHKEDKEVEIQLDKE